MTEPKRPDPAPDVRPVYEATITTSGVEIPFVPEIITPALEKPIRNNRYEGGEVRALREELRAGDRVLELGAGIGLLSTIAARTDGIDSVVAVEANPEMIPLIRETHRLNRVKNVTLLNGVVAPDRGGHAKFYLRADFWASSMEPDSRPYQRAIEVQTYAIRDLIAEYDPTVLVCDIEGGELGLFDDVDLSNVRLLILEFHHKVYGRRNVEALCDLFARKGLQIVPVEKPTTVRRFIRAAQPVEVTSWPPSDPRFFVATCMKDEGPFILEWIAWHKSIGIQDFVVFTNDCSDGTDHILDRLQELGHLRHLPNPALATGSTYFQPVALAYTPFLPEWRRADFFISLDVDEYINIRVGDGQMSDLLAASGVFDALSMSELNHGSNNRIAFEPGLVTEQFPLHQSERPGRHKARRGVKTIVRLSDKLEKARNHRPDFRSTCGEVTWLDGSARPLSRLMEDASLNGIDVRGSYDLVVLDHFPLRSLESYLIKMFRGDVVSKDKRVSQRYWRLRNKNEVATSTFDRQQKGFRRVMSELIADPSLSALHDRACDIHRKRAETLLALPEFQERRDWIFAHAWDADPT